MVAGLDEFGNLVPPCEGMFGPAMAEYDGIACILLTCFEDFKLYPIYRYHSWLWESFNFKNRLHGVFLSDNFCSIYLWQSVNTSSTMPVWRVCFIGQCFYFIQNLCLSIFQARHVS